MKLLRFPLQFNSYLAVSSRDSIAANDPDKSALVPIVVDDLNASQPVEDVASAIGLVVPDLGEKRPARAQMMQQAPSDLREGSQSVAIRNQRRSGLVVTHVICSYSPVLDAEIGGVGENDVKESTAPRLKPTSLPPTHIERVLLSIACGKL